MKTSQTTLMASALAFLAGCAPQTFRADVGAIFTKHHGSIALQNAGGSLSLGDERNSLEDNMGLGDTETSPYVRLQWDHELHRVRVHGFGTDENATGVLAGDFGGLVSGSSVTTSMRFYSIAASYSYAFLHDQNYRVGVGGELNFESLDLAAHSGAGRESVNTSVIVPMPFAEAEYYFTDWLSLGASAGLMSADLGDGNGRYWDAEGILRVQATEDIDVICGYRYLLMDVAGSASSRDFDADLDMRGLFFGGGIRF